MLAGATLASAGAADAADLIVLGPDSATISGSVQYNHVYIGDGATLRLAGDTTIFANDVYLAGGASLRTCFVQAVERHGCTAGRTLSSSRAGQVDIGSGINLTAGSGTNETRRRASTSRGTSVTVSGGIDTSGSMGGGSGSVAIASPGAVALGAPYYQAS